MFICLPLTFVYFGAVTRDKLEDIVIKAWQVCSPLNPAQKRLWREVLRLRRNKAAHNLRLY